MPNRALMKELAENYRSYVGYVLDVQDVLNPRKGAEALSSIAEGAVVSGVYFDTPTEPFSVLVWDSADPTNPPSPEDAVESAIDAAGVEPNTILAVMLMVYRRML